MLYDSYTDMKELSLVVAPETADDGFQPPRGLRESQWDKRSSHDVEA